MFNRIFIKYYTDNIELNLGVGGKTIATDDIGGIQHELVKVEFGVDGAATMVSSSNPLPVVDASATPAGSNIIGKVGIDQTTPGTTNGVQVNAALPAGANVIGHVIADTGSTTAVTGNVTVVQGTGSNLHAVLDASSAVIGHVIVDASSAIIGNVRIDQTTPGTTNGVQVNAALPAGTNAIGKLAANSGVTIGAVEIAAAQTLATVTTVSTVTAVTGITNNVNTVEVVGATIFNGKTTVATAGSRGTLASSQAVKSVTIKALAANTGLIYVGNASVASTNGFQLSAGDSISMDVANLNTVNIDSSVNGEGVTYIAVGV